MFEFLADYVEKGILYTICTDVSKDGLLQGSALDLYQQITERFDKLHLIASGGVTTMEEVHRLQETGCYGAIIGKAIYEGKISLRELESFILNNAQT